MRRARSSPIWPALSPTARTVSTAWDGAAVIARTSSAPLPRPPPCADCLPPGPSRPYPGEPVAHQVLVRSGAAGAPHTFAAACRAAGVGFSFGCPVDARVRDAVEILNGADGWSPAIESSGGIRDGAWVGE